MMLQELTLEKEERERSDENGERERRGNLNHFILFVMQSECDVSEGKGEEKFLSGIFARLSFDVFPTKIVFRVSNLHLPEPAINLFLV
jgi:hypothetical protein